MLEVFEMAPADLSNVVRFDIVCCDPDIVSFEIGLNIWVKFDSVKPIGALKTHMDF